VHDSQLTLQYLPQSAFLHCRFEQHADFVYNMNVTFCNLKVSGSCKNMAKRRSDLSVMRITATLAVILLHTCSTISQNPDIFKINKGQYLLFTTIVCLMNWAVPLFFMITGTLMLNPKKKLSVRDAVFKYAKRIFLALMIFGIPMAWVVVLITHRQISLKLILLGILDTIEGKSFSHLWYLYAIIGLYLIIPMLKPYVNSTSINTKRYILIVLFAFNFCFTLIDRLFNIHIAFELPIAGNSVFYLLTGEYLNEISADGDIDRKLNAFLIAVVVGTIIAINIIAYPKAPLFLGYDSPFIAALSILIYRQLFGVKCGLRHLWGIDRLTFGVYLIHPIFIHLAYNFLGITPMDFKPLLLSILVIWAVVVTLSFVSSYILKHIKWLRDNIL